VHPAALCVSPSVEPARLTEHAKSGKPNTAHEGNRRRGTVACAIVVGARGVGSGRYKCAYNGVGSNVVAEVVSSRQGR